MKFHSLHESLRKATASRIAAGQITQRRLAQETGFRQAHISNFLNKKRLLSLDGLDRVLGAQHLSIRDLLDPPEGRRSSLPSSESDFEDVVMVDGPAAASEPIITVQHVKDILKFKKGFLRRLRSDMASPRQDWHRFILLKTGLREDTSMYPRILGASTVLIDRHYNSLTPYRKSEANMYAVRTGPEGGWAVRYLELTGNNLVLRPHDQSYPVALLPIPEKSTFTDHVIGRVCHVANEV